LQPLSVLESSVSYLSLRQSLYFELKDKLQIKESDPLPKKLINQYAVTKRLAEIELENSPIPFVILRPRALTGRGDTVIMPRLIRAYDEGKLKVIGDGKNWVDLTAVSNVVDAIILSIKVSGGGINQTYNITNGKPVQLWASIAQLLPLLNRELPKNRIPYLLAINVARVLEFISKATTNKEPALTVYSIGILAKSFTLDISKAKKLLGYNPTIFTDEAITEFAEWYKSLQNN
jgi:nucleoside-diphosphate-sugar epimerase